jgi:hypothetical protein
VENFVGKKKFFIDDFLQGESSEKNKFEVEYKKNSRIWKSQKKKFTPPEVMKLL